MTAEDPKVIFYLLNYNKEYKMQSLHVCARSCRIGKIYIYAFIHKRTTQTKEYIFRKGIYNATTHTSLLFAKSYRKASPVADSA